MWEISIWLDIELSEFSRSGGAGVRQQLPLQGSGWVWDAGAEQQLRAVLSQLGTQRLSPSWEQPTGDETNAERQGHNTESAAGLSEIVNSHLALINEIRLN